MNAFIVALLAISVADPAPASRPEVVPIDCGPSALYLLLRLEGREVDISSLAQSLPPRPGSGTSMKELRDEAARHGLRLRGVRLRPGERPEASAIAYLSDGAHGHFIVLRPTGHSGKLVQVLDLNEMPTVVDREALASLPRWTGLMLVLESPNWPLRAAGLLAVLMALATILGAGMRRRKIGRRLEADFKP
jgi:hypothetical protein